MRLACTVVIGLVPLGAPAAEVVKLDFGTGKSTRRAGFIRITDRTRTDKAQTIGWTAQGVLAAKDAPVQREWVYSQSRGFSSPPPRYTTDLSQDHVESAESATLQIPFPNGAYRLWVLAGHASGNRYQVWDVTVGAGARRRTVTFPGRDAIRKIEGVLTLRHLPPVD